MKGARSHLGGDAILPLCLLEQDRVEGIKPAKTLFTLHPLWLVFTAAAVKS